MPLSSVRLVELSGDATTECCDYLEALGAERIVISAADLARGSKERADRYERVVNLLAGADICVAAVHCLRAIGLSPDAIGTQLPHLVTVVVSAFGLSGPYRDYRANDAVLSAMGGVLCRSGVGGREPLLPPPLARSAASIQAAWAALLGYWNQLEDGYGDLIDFSLFEATAQILDPALGAVGTAAASQGGVSGRGRPRVESYPIFACGDGDVRLVVLAKRQWRALWRWMGEPAEFADERFDTTSERFRHADRLYPFMSAFFQTLTVDMAVSEGQARGVPIAPVLTLDQVRRANHFEARGAFHDISAPDGSRLKAPAGYLRIDGVRATRMAARKAIVEWSARPRPIAPRAPRIPLTGIRVLDLGVIVMGAEAGRLLADQGAEVIKVESLDYPDGSRVAIQGKITPAFAASHRNKLSLGLNLRNEEGLAVFRKLVERSDVLLSNFKPGTLESLGLGPDELRKINPQIIVTACSAMGADGPWAQWMGYGPLVRCVTGLTSLWAYPDDAGAYGDVVTIYPDHLAARVVDIAVLAALIRRKTLRRGAYVECAQAEVIINALAEVFSSGPAALEYDAPFGVFPCVGDDEWCVVTVESDADFQNLATCIERPDWLQRSDLQSRHGRRANRRELHGALEQWTAQRTPREVTTFLQSKGIAAGFMMRLEEYASDPHLSERGFIRHVPLAWSEQLVRMENLPFKSRRIPDPPIAPSPLRGAHTRDCVCRLLGLSDQEFDELVRCGALEPAADIKRDA